MKPAYPGHRCDHYAKSRRWVREQGARALTGAPPPPGPGTSRLNGLNSKRPNVYGRPNDLSTDGGVTPRPRRTRAPPHSPSARDHWRETGKPEQAIIGGLSL